MLVLLRLLSCMRFSPPSGRALVRCATRVVGQVAFLRRSTPLSRVNVWMGMPHGFAGSVGRLKASAQALDAIGTFLGERRQVGIRP
jgi:hypothetical protein